MTYWYNLKGDETDVFVKKIGDKVLGGGEEVSWDKDHPLGWDTVLRAARTFHHKLAEEFGDGYDKVGEPHISVCVNSRGVLWMNTLIFEDSLDKLIEVVEKVLEEYPGLEKWMNVDFEVEEEVLFTGTVEECEKYIKDQKNDS